MARQLAPLLLPPKSERRNKTAVHVCGVRNTRGFLDWIRSKSTSRIVAQITGEYLVLVLETADSFRATICALRSLSEGKGVSFQTNSLSWSTNAYAYC